MKEQPLSSSEYLDDDTHYWGSRGIALQHLLGDLEDLASSKKPRVGQSEQSIQTTASKDFPVLASNSQITGTSRKALTSLGFRFHDIPKDWNLIFTPSRPIGKKAKEAEDGNEAFMLEDAPNSNL